MENQINLQFVLICKSTIKKTKGMNRTLVMYSSDLEKNKAIVLLTFWPSEIPLLD